MKQLLNLFNGRTMNRLEAVAECESDCSGRQTKEVEEETEQKEEEEEEEETKEPLLQIEEGTRPSLRKLISVTNLFSFSISFISIEFHLIWGFIFVLGGRQGGREAGRGVATRVELFQHRSCRVCR